MTIRSHALITVALTVALALSASSVSAQQASPSLDARWSVWLGCWTPAARRNADADMQLCMVPTADYRGIVRMTFAGDKELLSETVVADGTPLTAPENSCVGTRQSRWSQSGSRLFFSSSMKCPNQPDIVTTGLSALVTADQWLDVQVVKSGTRPEQTRTQRFWRSSSAPPAPVADRIAPLTRLPTVVPPVTVDDVIEASGNTAPNGVEAWLSESNARVPVDRQTLVRLADNQVPGQVIDLMVALAYPRKFEVRRASPGGGGGFFDGDATAFFPGVWSNLAGFGLGYGAWGVPYFYGTYPYPFNADYYYYLPATVGSGAVGDEAATHGQVVNGQGYTRVQPRETYRGAVSRSGTGDIDRGYTSSVGSDGGGSGAASSGSSGASPAGYSGGGGADTGLTAVPR